MTDLETQVILGAFDWIKSFFQSNNRMPTEQELVDELNNDLSSKITIGDQWLKDHPQGGN